MMKALITPFPSSARHWGISKSTFKSTYTCSCLSIKRVPKSTFKTQFWEIRQKWIFSTLVWPTLYEGQNSYKSHKNRWPCLSLKWVPKSTFKTQLWESRQKCIFSNLVWQTLNKGQNSSKSHKICVCAYLSNGYLNLLWNFNFKKVDKSAYFLTFV